MQQVQRLSGIRALPYDFAPFIRKLDAVGDTVAGHRHLVQLLQVVVFDAITRHKMALYLPELIVRSLEPATDPTEMALRAAGFSQALTREIISDAYRRDLVVANIRGASAKTVGLFEAHDVLQMPGVRERFADCGLLPD